MSDIGAWAVAAVVLLNSLIFLGIAIALWVLHSKMDQWMRQTQPLLKRAEETVGKVEALTEMASQRVTHVLDTADHLVRDVSQKVETTTSIAEETISQPLIGAASLMAGISRGLSAYKEVTEKGEGPNNG